MTPPRDKPPVEPSAREDELAQLRRENAELKQMLGRALTRIEKLETELNHSRAQVAWFHRQLFGQKAERTPKDLEAQWLAFLKAQEDAANAVRAVIEPPLPDSYQLLLGLWGEEPKPAPPEVSAESPAGAPPEPKAPRRGHGRGVIPKTLREEVVVLQPDRDELTKDARPLEPEVSYRLAVRPAELVRLTVVRLRVAVAQETSTKVISAPVPDEMIPRGLLSPSGLAHVIAEKFERHTPYHRMSAYFASLGFHLPKSTMSEAVIRAAQPARRLVDAMEAYAKEVAPFVAIDATGALLQHAEVCLRGHTWARWIEDVCVLMSFTRTHDSVSAGDQLDGWSCPALCDGASVFDAKLRETKTPRAGCWSHARRNLVYALETDTRAVVGVKLINELFAVERQLLDAEADVRLGERKKRSAPVMDQLTAWRDDLLATGNLGRSLLAKALRYLRNQEERLRYFLSDGRIPIHNNQAELQLRHFAVGRKNWLFYGSEAGAEAASVWLSLVLSAKMHGLAVEPYLRDLCRVLPSWPQNRLLELAPHRWTVTRDRLEPDELRQELGPLAIPSALH